MGLFRFLTKRTKQMQDEVFGLVTFRPYKVLKHDYFVGSVYFAPVESDVDVYLYADYKGPTASQREFYRRLETRYTDLLAKAEPLLAEALQKNAAQNSPAVFDKDYRLGCISIPDTDTAPVVWALDFVSLQNEDHKISVRFSDEEPQSVSMER